MARAGDVETPREVWGIDTSSILQVRREQSIHAVRARVFGVTRSRMAS